MHRQQNIKTSESCRGSFKEIKINGMAIMRNVDFVLYLMKVNCNNVKRDATNRVRNHELTECVRNTFVCVYVCFK